MSIVSTRVAAAFFALTVSIFTVEAEAAVVSGIKGTILANSGNGYQPVAEGAELPPGSSVIANPGSTAQIVYADGTIVEVVPGTVSSVFETGAMAAAASGGAVATGGAGAFTATGLVVGGLGAAGIAGVVAAASSSSDKTKPASP